MPDLGPKIAFIAVREGTPVYDAREKRIGVRCCKLAIKPRPRSAPGAGRAPDALVGPIVGCE